MQKVKNISLFILPLLLIGAVTSLFFQNRQLAIVKRSDREQVEIDSLKMDQFYRYAIKYGDFVPVPFSKEMLVTYSSNRVIKLGAVVNSRKFIFHFDETNCFTCVEKFLPYLEKLGNKVGKRNVIIMGSYEKSENLFATLARLEVDEFPVYNLDPVYLKDTRIGDLNAPFIFETDSLFQTKRFFIPEKEFPALSELYLKKI
jgi:hypothetical protein